MMKILQIRKNITHDGIWNVKGNKGGNLTNRKTKIISLEKRTWL